MQSQNNRIQQNYDQKALNNNDNALKREQRRLYESNSFNNWIKSVLMNVYSENMCKRVEKQLDLKKGDKWQKILHVLDIGCGRGQDILKWKLSRVNYMVATDFSPECVKQYERRWKDIGQPYRLYTAVEDFKKPDLFFKVEHSYYDMVSAQLCFHYMFSSQKDLRTGLNSIFSNLLIGGVFIATIPDSYTILKKINEKGIKKSDGSVVYGNKYFSIRFKNTKFTKPFGNAYEFYLEEAIGNKNPQTGQIQYVEEWLVPLDDLQKMLEENGVVIQSTMNFLEFYLKYRNDYKELFAKFKLNYEPEKHMDPQIWQIGHLYRVLVCRKTSKGKRINEFDLGKRNLAARKQIPRQPKQRDHDRSRNKNFENRDKKYESHSHGKYDRQRSDKPPRRDHY